MAAKISFWEHYMGDKGNIIISGLDKETIKMLEKKYVLSPMKSTPQGHTEPVHQIKKIKGEEDFTQREYFDLCGEFNIHPDLSHMSGIVNY